MVSFIQAVILSIIQGVTEWFPISSSGHLAIMQEIFGFQNLGFDVYLHFASVLAVVILFGEDIVKLFKLNKEKLKTESVNLRKKKVQTNTNKINKEFNQQARKIITRINEFKAAENLYDISKIPQARLHPLRGNLERCFAVDLKHPFRIIISPLNGDISKFKTITSIRILNIIDYH